MAQQKAKYKVRKDDQVQITVGKDSGKSGRILKVDRDRGRVVIEGLNMVSKAVRPKSQNEKGGIIQVEAPLHISNVMILCRKCGPTRVGYRLEGENKVRFCKKCGESL
jgi:large subunit ribosomal protein L24